MHGPMFSPLKTRARTRMVKSFLIIYEFEMVLCLFLLSFVSSIAFFKSIYLFLQCVYFQISFGSLTKSNRTEINWLVSFATGPLPIELYIVGYQKYISLSDLVLLLLFRCTVMKILCNLMITYHKSLTCAKLFGFCFFVSV